MLFEMDEAAERADTADRTTIAFHVVVAVGVALVACTIGQPALRVPPGYILFGTALFIANLVESHLYSTATGAMFRPANWPRRLLCFALPLLYCALFAAPSANPVTPTWAFTVMVGAAAGISSVSIGADRIALGVFLIVATSWVTSPSPTPLSIGTSVAVAALFVVALHVGQRFGAARRATATRLEAARRIADDARAEAARLAVAMSVHDGLSGAVFAAHARLGQTPHLAPDITAHLVERARGVLSSSAEVPLPALLRSLPGAATTHLELTVDDLTSLPANERLDLIAIATEFTANALRHRAPTALHVRVTTSPLRSVEVHATGPRRASESGGRGGRNVALRVTARGGTSSLDESADGSLARAHWAPSRPRNLTWVALSFPLVTLGFVPISLLGEVNVAALVFTVACVALATAGMALATRALARHEAEVRSFDDVRARTVEAAHTELRSLAVATDALEQTGDVTSFGRHVTQTLQRLENGAVT